MPPRPAKKATATKKLPYTAACLFAGMGGFADGFIKAGFKVLWSNEIDKFAAASYNKNYPKAGLILGDIKTLSVEEHNLAEVDVLTAGFPCQSFSITGEKKGFEDERGALFFEIIRIIKEFGEKRPKILLLENVPNLMAGGNGVWFETIKREIQRAGYWFDDRSCEILNTCEITEIPQNRKRLFLVGVSTEHFKYNGYLFPPVVGKTLPLNQYIYRKKKADESEYLPHDNKYYRKIEEMMKEGDRKSIFQLRRFEVREKNRGVCPTLTANMGGGGHNVPFVFDKWGIRRLSVNECASLQGFENYQFPPEVPIGERYKQIGNAVSPPVAQKLANSCKIFLMENKT